MTLSSRINNFGLSILFFILISTSYSSAQSMYYHTKDGNLITYDLINVSNMTFTNDDFVIRNANGTIDSYLISNFGQIYFQFNTALDLTVNDKLINVYPNPVNEILNFTLFGEIKYSALLQILNLEGEVMIEQKILNSGRNPINMSQLPNGIYLCRYNNGAVITTEKIVKQ